MCRLALLLFSCLLLFAACNDEESSSSDYIPPIGEMGLAGMGGGTGLPEDGGTGPADQEGEEVPLPTLEILEPPDGASIPSHHVEVSGHYENTDRVLVNGQAAQLSDGEFRIQIELPEGDEHEIRAEAGAISESIQVRIDQVPPRIDFIEPTPGTHRLDSAIDLQYSIHDPSLITEVLFNGLNEDTSQIPNFLISGLGLDDGLNIFQVQASDSAGNIGKEHLTVLQGETSDPDLPLPGAIRLHMGAQAFIALEEIIAGLLMEQDLSALLGDEPLLDLGIFRVSILSLEMPNPPQVDLILNPEAENIGLNIQMQEVSLRLGLFWGQSSTPIPLTIHVMLIEAQGAISLQLEGGQLLSELEDLEVQLHELRLTGESPPNFPDEPGEQQSLLEEISGGVITLLLEQQLAGLMDDYLGVLDDPIDFEVLGAALRIHLLPSAITITAESLSVRVDVRVELFNPPPNAPPVPGFVGTKSLWAGVPNTDQVALILDDDLINLLLFQIWRAGVLLPTIDREFAAEFGSQVGVISTLIAQKLAAVYSDVNAATPLSIASTLPLPIIVRVIEVEGAAGLRLSVGDLQLHVEQDDPSARVLLDGRATLQMDSLLSIAQGDEGLQIDLSAAETITLFDVVTEELRGRSENNLEEPFGDLLNTVGALLPGLVSGIPLPAIGFLSFDEITVGVAGPEKDFLSVIVTLSTP